MEQSIINWNRAITTNRSALGLVVEEIFGLLELVIGSATSSLPPAIAAMVGRLLRPAESALRRLIIIMARDLKVALPPKHPMPQGRIIKATGSGRMAFRLYDTRIRQRPPRAEEREPKGGPRIHFFHDRGPLVPLARPQKPARNAASLVRRFTALKLALESLPRQVKRMALWRLRRQAKASAKFRSPLRPGQPPGHQQRPWHKVDDILAACHGLAHEALYGNTS